jgi:hypothetical protein
VKFYTNTSMAGPQKILGDIGAFQKYGPRYMYKSSLVMRELIRDTFRNAVDPWGNAWRPLKPATLRERKRRGFTATKTLIRTGALFESVNTRVSGDRIKMTAGEGLEYAESQQFGNEFNTMFGNPAPIPKRRFLPVWRNNRVVMPESWWDKMLEPWDNLFSRVLGR